MLAFRIEPSGLGADKDLVITLGPGIRRTWRRRLGGREDGQALVEFALVLPLFLILLTAILQFGSAYNKYLTLNDAVRDGARALALERGSLDPCDPAIKQTLESSDGLLTSAMVVDAVPSNPASTAYVTPTFSSGTSPIPDYCASTALTTGCGATATSYTYNADYDSTTTDGGCEVEPDEATITAGVPYTLNVFGLKIYTLTLRASASDAIE